MHVQVMALDDERLALEQLKDAIQGAAPEMEIYAFRKWREALKEIEEISIPALDRKLPVLSDWSESLQGIITAVILVLSAVWQLVIRCNLRMLKIMFLIIKLWILRL